MAPTVDYTKLVTITVGKSKAAFQIHKDILVESSKFFRAKYSPEWTQATEEPTVENPFHIPWVDQNAFSSYIGWAYSGKIDSATAAFKSTKWIEFNTSQKQNEAQAQLAALIRLAIFADQVNAPALLNQAIDDMIRVMDVGRILPHPSALELAWKNLPETSGVRRMFLHRCAMWLTYDDLRACKEKQLLPDEFWIDLAMFYRKCIDKSTDLESLEEPTVENACAWHEHGEGIPACTTEVERGTLDNDDKNTDPEDTIEE